MRRVLIVDDNEDVRAVLRAMLEDADYEVAEAADGPEALSFALQRRPNVILLDLQLPPDGGFEVLEQIMKTVSLRKVPVIIVTGSIDDDDLRTAKKLGAWDYVNKPWAIGEVEARVRLALQVADAAGPTPSEPEESPARDDTATRKKRQSARAPERAPHG
ncbi:MAG: response regulator [Chloroflexi bacterium]|nr:response regulator [Chloroflexota bacterium]